MDKGAYWFNKRVSKKEGSPGGPPYCHQNKLASFLTPSQNSYTILCDKQSH